MRRRDFRRFEACLDAMRGSQGRGTVHWPYPSVLWLFTSGHEMVAKQHQPVLVGIISRIMISPIQPLIYHWSIVIIHHREVARSYLQAHCLPM